MAPIDTVRAQGGGTLRGVPLTVNEAPAGIGGGTPAGAYTFANQDTVSLNVRVQRNF